MSEVNYSNDRFIIEELATEYSLHADMRDIYVEGQSDKDFFEQFGIAMDWPIHFQVRKIDSVDIPGSLLDTLGLTRGERQEVIAFSHELSDLLSQDAKRPPCVADADFNYVGIDHLQNSFLLYTDPTSLELYAYTDVSLSKLLTVALKIHGISPSNVRAAITNPLIQMFSLRYSFQVCAIEAPVPDMVKWCKIDKNNVQLDIDSKVKEYLISKSLAAKVEEVMSEIASFTTEPSAWQKVHGHDFIGLLSAFLENHVSKPYKAALRNSDVFRGLVMGSLDSSHLVNHRLFQELHERMI